MWRGRTTRLTLESLGNVPIEDRAKHARRPLVEVMEATESSRASSSASSSSSQAVGKSSHWFLSATLKAYRTEMLMPILPRLILLAATFCQPFLVSQMVSYVQDPEESSQKGWYLVAGFVCVFWVRITSPFYEKILKQERHRGWCLFHTSH